LQDRCLPGYSRLAREGYAMKNALTVDLEDWYHPELVKRQVRGEPASQIVASTHEILDLFDRHHVKATFFVLGDVARKHPDLIRTIHRQGHEIASHGMSHKPLWDLSADEFDEELRQFARLMADLLGDGVKLKGFRAPTFSLDNRTKYALGCLERHGYAYDTSVFPVKNYMYGVSGAPCTTYRPDADDVGRADDGAALVEFPMTVCELGRFRVPVSGGFYLRVLPYFVFRALLRRVNRERPFVLYFHPWETHRHTPRTRGIGLKNALITYYGLRGALRKIERLLQDFEFEPMADVLDRVTPARRAPYHGPTALHTWDQARAT
jgi:polysaccharide deacetylase family protein (PEP-CTERM system associated)